MAKNRAPRGPSDEVLLKQAENRHEKLVNWRYAIIGSFIVLGTLATVPLALVIAGKETTFNASVSINISVALAITQTLTLAGLRHSRKTARHLRDRNEKLEERVKQLEHLDRRGKGASDSLTNHGAEEVTS